MNRGIRDAKLVLELAAEGRAVTQMARDVLSRPPFTKHQKAPRKAMREPTRKAKREGKRAKHREEMAELRRAVLARAGVFCESPDGITLEKAFTGRCPEGATDLDHWLGGSGRRRQFQGVENTWQLCAVHHELRTTNNPSAARWNEAFRWHCEKYGYAFVPHKELAR